MLSGIGLVLFILILWGLRHPDKVQALRARLSRNKAVPAEEAEEAEDSLVGLQVRDSRTNRQVGTIVDFNDYGGNLLITVETPGGEVLLPIHEDLIVSIHDDTLTLDIPEGLLPVE